MSTSLCTSAHAETTADILARRNPYLAEIRAQDETAFLKAVAIISEQKKTRGLREDMPPPETYPPGRDMGGGLGRELTPENPDILWLYNSSPEGMNDLISLLKNVGQKPKK
ncbi:hypothetical protein F4V90_18570 [Neorhizobium galegae]|nr:hypothetical protein F4V90_18570 [Neorhizobium galegae]